MLDCTVLQQCDWFQYPVVSFNAYFWAYAGLAAVVVDGERFPVEGGRERSPWMQVRAGNPNPRRLAPLSCDMLI